MIGRVGADNGQQTSPDCLPGIWVPSPSRVGPVAPGVVRHDREHATPVSTRSTAPSAGRARSSLIRRVLARTSYGVGSILVLRLLAFAQACQSDTPVVDCTTSAWDTDCDGISDAVETSPANGRYNLVPTRKDSDPSFPNGTPENGSLTNGLKLPDANPGYYEYRPASDPRWDQQPDSNDWGTLRVINAIEASSRGWIDVSPPTNVCNVHSCLYCGTPRATQFGVGDISKFGGDLWLHSYDAGRRHDFHRNGLEVDIRYIRKDRNPIPLDIQANPQDYDINATYDLMSCFVNKSPKGVSLIYADSASLGFWDPTVLVNKPGHTNHFHVRVVY